MATFIEKLNEWVEPFRGWLYENHNNPIVWGGFFIIGLAIFAFTYSSLTKYHQ